MEISELLTEWMQEKAGGSDYALDWMQGLAWQFCMAVATVPPSPSPSPSPSPDGGWWMVGRDRRYPDEPAGDHHTVGRLSGTAVEAMPVATVSVEIDTTVTSVDIGEIPIFQAVDVGISNGWGVTRSTPVPTPGRMAGSSIPCLGRCTAG
jgi:hypothetical protein